MKHYGLKPLPEVGSKSWLKELQAALNCPTFFVTPSSTKLFIPASIESGEASKKEIQYYVGLQIGRSMIDSHKYNKN